MFLVGVLVIVGAICFPMLNHARVTPRRAACGMNLGNIGKGICLYQAVYKEQYPALANPATLAQGGIAEEPEMVAVVDSSDESAFLTGDVKGNGSVNAYYLLVAKGYTEEEGFRCPSDDTYYPGGEGTDAGRGYDLGFDGWGNISYALQPTSLDAAAFSARPSNGSKGDMAIASDQVVDRDTALTKMDNRPKENNSVNHGYEYINVLLIDGSVRRESRTKGADSTASKWGYDGDEIFTKTNSIDPIKRANDSILMGKEGGENGKPFAVLSPATIARARELERREACAKNLARLAEGIRMYQSTYSEKFPALAAPEPKPKVTPMGTGNDRE